MGKSHDGKDDASRQAQQAVHTTYVIQEVPQETVFVDVMPMNRSPQMVIVNDNHHSSAASAYPTVATSMSSQLVYCTVCSKVQATQVSYSEVSLMPICCWIFLIIICFPFSLFLLCCPPVPTRVAVHKCPQCHTTLGSVTGL